jgi:hypothetical protein
VGRKTCKGDNKSKTRPIWGYQKYRLQCIKKSTTWKAVYWREENTCK